MIQFKNQLEAVVYTYTVSQLLTNSEKIGLEQLFKKADVNSDGSISPAEFKEIMRGRMKDEERF
jgi:Ca2+-binding EF-hand superfamily protein